MAANPTECFRLVKRSMKFLVVENCNNVKFTEKCGLCTEKPVLVKKCLQMG